jgi:hypothetical protein
MRDQIVRVLQHIANELFRFLFLGGVERRQATLSANLLAKELAMFSVRVTVLQKDCGVTPADEVTTHRKMWPVRRETALLLK